MQRRPERISSIDVERGLYVLRYAGVPGTDSPTIYVRPSPGSEESVSIISWPGEPAAKLAAPGSLVVVLVDDPATLQITAQATAPGGSLQAEVRLEPLRAAGAMASGPGAPAQLDPAVEVDGDLQVLAHVARRGDVKIGGGEWVGGPEAPAPIEGLALYCPPHVGTLHYQVLSAGESRWSEWMDGGAFAGTRGRARPLAGVRLRLVPARDKAVSLEGEALFLGSVLVRKSGLEMEFRSSAGVDPLVGFRIGLQQQLSAPAIKPAIVATGAPSGRVRVFKASSARRSG